jgi:hypothetical protein
VRETAQGLILGVSGVGYPLLFAIVAAEAGGLPGPGETALIIAATVKWFSDDTGLRVHHAR